MRFLPYLLVASMTLPIIIWFVIDKLVIKSSAAFFGTNDMIVLGSLGAVMLVAFYLLSTWMDKYVQRTRG